MFRREGQELGQEPGEELNLLLLPGSWDNLGAVLKGIGFKYKKTKKSRLGNPRTLVDCNVVFFACGLKNSFGLSGRPAENLRQFVAEGGAVYCSDLASAVVDRVFPGKIQFSESASYAKHVQAEVLDPGLSEILGTTIQLHFDCVLHGIHSTRGENVRIYLRGEYEVDGQRGIYPLVVSFNHGNGQVIYTTFHNSVQVSEDEQKLLRYLIFRPIVARAANVAAQMVKAHYCTPGKEIIASINPKSVSDRYVLNLAQPTTILFVLSWQGSARLGLVIQDPRGAVFRDAASASSPFTVEVPSASVGPWSCWVKGMDVPYRNFPYVLTLATQQAGVGARAPRGAVGAGAAPTVAPIQTKRYVPLYFVIECSELVGNQSLKVIRQGLQRLAGNLARNPESARAVRMSLITLGVAPEQAVLPVEAREFAPPPLRATGGMPLGGGLEILGTSISRSIAPSAGVEAGKPLVFMLLAGRPTDNWQGQAQMLLGRVQRKEVNVIILSLGGGVDVQVARSITQVPLLAIEDTTPENLAAFFGWVEQAVRSLVKATVSRATGTTFSLPPLPPCVQAAG